MNSDQHPEESGGPNPRFGLLQLFAFTAWSAACVALWTWLNSPLGLMLGLVVTAVAFAIIKRDSTIAVFSVLLIILTAVVAPDLDTSRGDARRRHCINNLKQIGLALMNYESQYGTLPPVYIADFQGRPMHSWRVLILPFMEQNALYKKYRFDEPWDGPNNRLLHGAPNDLFHCGADEYSPGNHTSYFAVLGPDTMWKPGMPHTFNDVTDGARNTILVVERHNAGVHWMDPRDVDVSTYVNEQQAGIATQDPGHAFVLWGDGRAGPIAEETSPEQLQGMFTPAGGEASPSDE